MAEDPIIQEALGPHIYERFLDAKRQEWDSYRLAVSQWELDRYLRVF
jgi:glutamine synthetase